MLNSHHGPAGHAAGYPLTSMVQDQVTTAVAANVHTRLGSPPKMPANVENLGSLPPSRSAEPLPAPAAAAAERGHMDRTAALLMFGLTTACFVFLAYLVTIDKADLQTGIPATLFVVLTLNAAVFGTRTWVRRARQAAATASYAVGDALNPGTGGAP